MSQASQTGISISRYLNVQQAIFPSFSSDGQRLSFISDITGVPQVWQVSLQDRSGKPAWPERLTFEAERVAVAEFSPAPGDGRLLYARDVGGNENMQLLILSADGTCEIPLTAGYEEAMHIPGEWSDDGRRILFAANRRHRGLFDLYVQPVGGEALMVWENSRPGYLYSQRFAPDGRHAVVIRTSSSFHHELIEIDLESGVAKQLLPSDRDVRYLTCIYADQGRSLYLNTDMDSEYLYVARLDLESGAFERLVAPEWDVECLACSPDGRWLAYAVNVEGAHRIQVHDLQTGQTRTAPGLEQATGIVTDGRFCFSRNGARLAFSFTSATRTADIYVWDLVTDSVQPVTHSSHGGIPPASFVAPELVRYSTFDDEPEGASTERTSTEARPDGGRRRIPAWFYMPVGQVQEPVPAVVLVHGGPEGQYRPSFQFLVQYLVHHGYAVLAPNVRGSTGYGKAYSHLDDVEKRMDSVADLAYAVHWLRGQPGIDGKRIAVYGGSYGGFMVLAALTAYPDLWAAGVDIVGISNLVTFLENTSTYRRAHREAEYGSLERDREFLESIAPIRHVDRISAPLLVIHGANDPRVPLGEAEQLVQALQARQVPVEFLVFDDEGHGLVKLKNKLVAYPAVVDFLNKYLG